MKLYLLLHVVLIALYGTSFTAATCAISGMGVNVGNVPGYNVSSRIIMSEWWRYDGRPDPSEGRTRSDECVASCKPSVVITTAMETVWNVFVIAVNGRYLMNDYTWSDARATLPIPYFDSNIPSRALKIGINTPISPGSNIKFFTGSYNRGKIVANSGQYQPIYQIPFNHWQCQTKPSSKGEWSKDNYVQIANTMPAVSGRNWAMCGTNVWTSLSFKIRRSCNSTVVGDPQFVGLRGQDYQVHGIDGAIYNLWSAPTLSIASRFVYLQGPRDCPIIPSTNEKSIGCWSHPGSYLDNIAVLNGAGSRLLVQSGTAASGLSVTLNDRELQIGESAKLDDVGSEWVHFKTTHEVQIVAGVAIIDIENSDGFVNLARVSVPAQMQKQLKADDTHGLLGQTWRLAKKVIEGRVDDYLIESGLFGTDFIYNRFKA